MTGFFSPSTVALFGRLNGLFGGAFAVTFRCGRYVLCRNGVVVEEFDDEIGLFACMDSFVHRREKYVEWASSGFAGPWWGSF